MGPVQQDAATTLYGCFVLPFPTAEDDGLWSEIGLLESEHLQALERNGC